MAAAGGAIAIVGATAVTVVLFLLALRGRSWSLWLLGYAATVATLALAWRFR